MPPGFVTVASTAETPVALPPANGHTSGRRLALAEWMVSAENPLTARVIVNRVWHHHFGRGLFASLDNVGKWVTSPRILSYSTIWLPTSAKPAGASSACTNSS